MSPTPSLTGISQKIDGVQMADIPTLVSIPPEAATLIIFNSKDENGSEHHAGRRN
jgi:hypothetical protein